MKQSNYNYFFPLESSGQVIAYNGIEKGLCILEPELHKKLVDEQSCQSPASFDSEQLAQLELGGFLIQDEFDELKYLRHKQYESQFQNGVLSLTIAPTINCNLACPYCFEGHTKGRMSIEVMDAIAEFVAEKIKFGSIKQISVTWYGGEPLLYPDVIESLSNKMILVSEEGKVPYHASIITNGTRYTPEVAAMLKNSQVENVQITIDGNKWSHDCRRVNKGGGGSFDQIFSNIKNTVGIIPISIRINVDRSNVAFGLDTYELFRSQAWFDSDHFSFYFGWVRQFTKAVSGVGGNALTPEEFHQEAEKLKNIMITNGDMVPEMPGSSYGCVATNVNGYVIGPGGHLWKCWTTLGEMDQAFGNILEQRNVNAHYLKYMQESWVDDVECRNCKALPMCMGGCTDVRIKNESGLIDHKDCGVWRFQMEEKLQAYVNHIMCQKQDATRAKTLPFAVPINV